MISIWKLAKFLEGDFSIRPWQNRQMRLTTESVLPR